MPVPGLGVGAETKPCSRCKAVKPLGEFYRDPRVRSGRCACCKACDVGRHVERYRADPACRAAKLARNLAYRAEELGCLVSERACCRAQLRGAVKDGTKDKLRRRIADLDARVAELRAGRGRKQERVRDVA